MSFLSLMKSHLLRAVPEKAQDSSQEQKQEPVPEKVEVFR